MGESAASLEATVGAFNGHHSLRWTCCAGRWAMHLEHLESALTNAPTV